MHFRPVVSRLAVYCLLALSFVACGCNYHGRIRRNIYKKPPFQEKLDLSVLVSTDRFIQNTITVDELEAYPLAKYIFQTKDGVSVAAADALGTLFTQADVGDESLASNYDYIAEIDYSVSPSNIHSHYVTKEDDRFFWREKRYFPGLKTTVVLTLRQPDSRQAAIKLSASRRHDISFSALAQSLYWLNEVTLSLFYPVFSPAFMQSSGGNIRAGLEKDLRECLSEIMNQLEENRYTLSKAHDQELLPRPDGVYRALLEKTVYLETSDGHGSGFFISPDGYMLTNAHVVENERDVRYYLYKDYPFTPHCKEPPFRYARVVKINKARDLALLKAEGEFSHFELDADRSHYKTGETVLVIGNPKEKFWTVSQGIISAVNDFNGTDEIQMDAAINPGNSGGPLVLKSSGKVIGVNARTVNPVLGGGMGYAISVYEVERTLGISQPLDGEKPESEARKKAPH